MATMSLSILGLENWCEDAEEDSLFHDFVYPTLFTSDEKELIYYNIMREAAPFEILYADPDVLRDQIGIWSASRQAFWNRVYDTWDKADDFNQLENFDRTETETIQHSGTDTTGNTQTRNLAGTDNRTPNLTDEHKVSAYDSADYSAKDRDTHTGTDNRSMSDTGTIADQGAFVHGHTIGRQARYHGNIGVTSLAQLIEGYNTTAEKWDLINLITAEFIKEFCVMVY